MVEKDDFDILRFIHRFFFYQNRFINEYARKKKAKFSESKSHRVTEFSEILRTCVLNINKDYKFWHMNKLNKSKLTT